MGSLCELGQWPTAEKGEKGTCYRSGYISGGQITWYREEGKDTAAWLTFNLPAYVEKAVGAT